MKYINTRAVKLTRSFRFINHRKKSLEKITQINRASIVLFDPVRRLHWNRMEADKATLLSPVNGKFKFKQLPDGTVNRNTVICSLCSKECSYHQSSSTLKYHLNAKHLVACWQVGAATAPKMVLAASLRKTHSTRGGGRLRLSTNWV